MPPGQSGRCPTCDALIRVPSVGPDALALAPATDNEWDWEGTYGVEEPAPQPIEPIEVEPRQGDGYDDHERADLPPAGPRSTSQREAARSRPRLSGEPWFPPRFHFPARGMEGLVMVVAVGTVVWVLVSLVPEYCLALIADGVKSGTPSMGYLVSLITATPVMFLSPLVATYWLQYLARVVVGSASGETTPPRPPDRDLDGLLSGLTRWISWSVLGLGVGLIPVWVASSFGVRVPLCLVGIGLVGSPYILMAFLLTFLHDEDLAARPWRVVAALVRVAPSFLVLTLVSAWLVGFAGGAYYLAFQLRAARFGTYLLVTLPCWYLIVWTSVVLMHTLGSYYYASRKQLRWRRPPAWWN